MFVKDKIINKIGFTTLLGFSALSIALCSAYYSTFGIANLFKGAFISAAIMALTLELGKLVAATFLFRFWKQTKTFIKTYLTIAVSVLVLITSVGIFGYLSAAYQQSAIDFRYKQDQIVNFEAQKPFYKEKIDQSKQRIDVLNKSRNDQEIRLSQALTNEFLIRNPIQLKQIQQQTIDLINQSDLNIKEENNKIQLSIDELKKLEDKINEFKIGSSQKKDIQTFKFVADALNMSLDRVAQLFILLLIFVFDPLALALILAYNISILRDEDVKNNTTLFDKNNKNVSDVEINKDNMQQLQSVFENKPNKELIDNVADVDDKKKLKWFQKLFQKKIIS